MAEFWEVPGGIPKDGRLLPARVGCRDWHFIPNGSVLRKGGGTSADSSLARVSEHARRLDGSILGVEKPKPNGPVRDNRLWRHFREVKKLSPAQRKPIIQALDAFLQGAPPWAKI